MRPALLFGESIDAVGHGARSTPSGRRRCGARGITDLDHVQIDPWPAGNFGIDRRGRPAHRPVHLLPARRRPRTTATPGRSRACIVYVDLGARRGARGRRPRRACPLAADGRQLPAPTTSGRCAPDLRRSTITQPEGPSFTVDGNLVRWQRWSLRVAFDPVRGPRAAPRSATRTAGGSGRSCTGRRSARWSCPTATPARCTAGRTRSTPASGASAACANSLDARLRLPRRDPLLRRHARRRARRAVRRSPTRSACTRRTTASSGSTSTCTGAHRGAPHRAGWSSAPSPPSATTSTASTGTSTSTARSSSRSSSPASCRPMARPAPPATSPASPTSSRRGSPRPHHQHLFCARLDLDVDGPVNAVHEVEAEPLPPGRPTTRGQRLPPAGHAAARRELEAQRDVDAGRVAGTWRIVNPERRATGSASRSPTGCCPRSPRRRCSPHPESTRRPAGRVRPPQPVGHALRARRAPGRGRVPQPARRRRRPPRVDRGRPRRSTDTDVVVWYTFGVTHVARPEDWPVMPVEYAGFLLSARSASSTATPPSTCPRRRTGTATERASAHAAAPRSMLAQNGFAA